MWKEGHKGACSSPDDYQEMKMVYMMKIQMIMERVPVAVEKFVGGMKNPTCFLIAGWLLKGTTVTPII